jgi:hypothetical protein
LKVGDSISIARGEKTAEVKISGIFQNFLLDYVYISENTAAKRLSITGKNAALVKYNGSIDEHNSSAKLLEDKRITSIND